MANIFKLSRDVRGKWRRQNLGLKPTENGDLTKPTFTFGKDHAEACRRVVVLEQMWTAVEKDWQKDKATACPVWNQETYNIALAVARGEQPIYLEVPPEDRETAAQYSDPETVIAVWIGAIREQFPFLDLRVKDEQHRLAAEEGATVLAQRLDRQAEALRGTASRIRGHSGGEPLHVALDAYSAHLSTRYGNSGHGRTQQVYITVLKQHLDNQPLDLLTADRIEAHLAYLANRPTAKSTEQPMAYTTCRNLLITFRQFLRWLHRSEAFSWEIPSRFTFPRQRIKKLPADRVQKRKTFKLDELTTIWKYALPWDRALILLSLNCGFSKAEIATLQAGEVVTNKKGKVFVKRTRVKTDAYGEWVLWEETLEALAHLKMLHQGGTPYLVVSKTGKPLDKKTKGGNENQTIKNHWDRLMKRVKADHHDFHKLPFKCLRKTGASLVRRLAPRRATELASMYLAHGEKADSADQLLPAYTTRPWKKLHKVLLRLRKVLLPVFQAVKEPWVEQSYRITPAKKEKIMALRREGKTYQEIGEAVGLHQTTVGKLCRRRGEVARPV